MRRLAIEVVAAVKGKRGFQKIDYLDSSTTICDNRVPSTTSLWNLVVNLTGIDNKEGLITPTHFKCKSRFERSDDMLVRMHACEHIFKYVKTGTVTESDDGNVIFEGVIVDNDNVCYTVKADMDGTIMIVRRHAAFEGNRTDTSLKEAIIVPMQPTERIAYQYARATRYG